MPDLTESILRLVAELSGRTSAAEVPPRVPRDAPRSEEDHPGLARTRDVAAPAPAPRPVCPVCHGHRWWRSIAGQTVCERCHPPADPALAAEQLSVEPGDRLGEGLTRWPAALELGVRRLGPFEPCALCETGTWVRYGEAPRCLECARDPGGAPRRRYRRALERWWTLVAQGERANLAAVATTYQEILKLHDDLGQPTADTLCREWAREWQRQTGCNPWSGQPEAPGEPRRGEDEGD